MGQNPEDTGLDRSLTFTGKWILSKAPSIHGHNYIHELIENHVNVGSQLAGRVGSGFGSQEPVGNI